MLKRITSREGEETKTFGLLFLLKNPPFLLLLQWVVRKIKCFFPFFYFSVISPSSNFPPVKKISHMKTISLKPSIPFLFPVFSSKNCTKTSKTLFLFYFERTPETQIFIWTEKNTKRLLFCFSSTKFSTYNNFVIINERNGGESPMIETFKGVDSSIFHVSNICVSESWPFISWLLDKQALSALDYLWFVQFSSMQIQ